MSIFTKPRHVVLNWWFRHVHLLLAVLIVVPTAIIYSSPYLLSTQLDVEIITIDQANQWKATALWYLACSAVWIRGLIKANSWRMATQLTAFFMLTLATGRLLSLAIDGIPSDAYLFAIVAECFIGSYAVWQLRLP